jgi:hypothetical protein
VSGLVGGSPVLSNMQVNDFTDRIINPRPKQDTSAPPAGLEPESESRPAWEETYGWNEQQQQEPSRAGAFDPSEEGFNPSGFDFAMGEQEAQADDIPPVVRELEPESPARSARQQSLMGMTPVQLAVLGGLALALVCILAVFAYVVFS